MKACSIDGCVKKHEAKGYCKVHYRSFTKYGDPLYVEQKRAQQEQNRIEKEKYKAITRQLMSTEGVCKVSDCDSSIYAKRLCIKHYGRHLRKGDLSIEKNVMKLT